jgi:hypothetical protein
VRIRGQGHLERLRQVGGVRATHQLDARHRHPVCRAALHIQQDRGSGLRIGNLYLTHIVGRVDDRSNHRQPLLAPGPAQAVTADRRLAFAHDPVAVGERLHDFGDRFGRVGGAGHRLAVERDRRRHEVDVELGVAGDRRGQHERGGDETSERDGIHRDLLGYVVPLVATRMARAIPSSLSKTSASTNSSNGPAPSIAAARAPSDARGICTRTI